MCSPLQLPVSSFAMSYSYFGIRYLFHTAIFCHFVVTPVCQGNHVFYQAFHEVKKFVPVCKCEKDLTIHT